MDAMKLLGNLMSNKTLSSSLGRKLLGGMLGGGRESQSSGGLAGLLGGGGGSGSGIGGMLGSVLGGGAAAGGIGGLLSGMMGREESEAPAATAPANHSETNEQAILMIRAMINAAKSDGRIDQTEQENIISKLGADVSQSEIDFLKREFAAPINVSEFADTVPQGMEPQIYAISLTSIELDTQKEAQYLGNLAQGMKMEPALCNHIHEQLGAPKIFN